jgi:23S rRNA pseudouridine1911/1915/1917 synthase
MKIDDDNEKAKIAITNYKGMKIYFDGKFSIIECKLETGRIHQIRLHMMSIGCPILEIKFIRQKAFIL